MTTNTNTHFENKEHYLAFRKAWSNAVNSEKAKKKVVDGESWDGSTVRITQKGWLTASHHILYNILRGRDYDYGFTLITNRNKLLNGMSPNLGLVQAMSYLGRLKQYPDYLEEFLAPFEGTVTVEMFLDIKFPVPNQLYKDFGPGMKVIPMLISGKAKARTQTDLETLLKEVA